MIYFDIKKKILVALFFLIIVFFSGCISDKENNSDIKYPVLEDITVDESYSLIQNNSDNQDFIILDIRTQEEFDSGHIQNSIMIDFYSDTFEIELDELDKNKSYLIYCRTGRRTGLTMAIMQDLGFIEVYNMLGGITQWIDKGYPIV
jgi:rhodanese-related sulfurtransferase